MRNQLSHLTLLTTMVAASLLPLQSVYAESTSCDACAPHNLLLYGVPIVVFLGAVLSVAAIRRVLGKSTWSLTDALSEEVSLPVWIEKVLADGSKTRELLLDADSKPVLVPEMRASTSRMIAMMGMVVLIFIYVGFGVFALYRFGRTGAMPTGMDDAVKFLLAALTLFAPYVVNKFSSLFEGVAGTK